MTAREAIDYLQIKRATLYTYVSRGWVKAISPGGSRKLYLRSDVERLKVRQRARAGHGAVAGDALRWGEPVLETRISNIEAGRLTYRGRDALDLTGHPFEQVATWLALGRWVEPAPWGGLEGRRVEVERPLRGETPLKTMRLVVARRGVPQPDPDPEREFERGAALVHELAAVMFAPERVERARAEATVAAALARASGLLATAREPDLLLEALNGALVLCAEHGLNASTFAARVIAATGADLDACLLGGFAALSGPLHGGACDRIEAVLDELDAGESADAVVARRLEAGMAGFRHPLYPSGDPRTAPLLAWARRLGGDAPRLQSAMALERAMRRVELDTPTVDFGLVALCAALGLPRGAAAGIFGLGRCAGWIAHVLEQRETRALIRPRARYIDEPTP